MQPPEHIIGGELDQVVGVVAHGALPVRVKECVQLRVRLQVELGLNVEAWRAKKAASKRPRVL